MRGKENNVTSSCDIESIYVRREINKNVLIPFLPYTSTFISKKHTDTNPFEKTNSRCFFSKTKTWMKWTTLHFGQRLFQEIKIEIVVSNANSFKHNKPCNSNFRFVFEPHHIQIDNITSHHKQSNCFSTFSDWSLFLFLSFIKCQFPIKVTLRMDAIAITNEWENSKQSTQKLMQGKL